MEPQCEYTTHWQQERLKWLHPEEEDSKDSSVNSEDYMDFPFESDKIDDIKQMEKVQNMKTGM